tara:strand:+ start:620 stop:1600 length:981 start_codon:yes stop_codon:yes gene_type:complete
MVESINDNNDSIIPTDDEIYDGAVFFNEDLNIDTTPNEDVNMGTTPILPESEEDINLRKTQSKKDGDTTIRVGNFVANDVIRLYGDYQQNYVDIPQFDLSKLIILNDDIANFNFILALIDGQSGIPQLYASQKVFNELNVKYSNSEPFPVNYLIHSRKIVVIELMDLKNQTETMREAELSINLNRNNVDGAVEVTRNLFTYSNYTTADGALVATPSYDLMELIKYISWAVNKPTGNYDDRLIPANELGDWEGEEATEPNVDEASAEVDDIVNDTYPPVGRIGTEDGEVVYRQGVPLTWVSEEDQWLTNDDINDIIARDTDDNEDRD